MTDTAFVLAVLTFALCLALAVLRLSKWAAARRAKRNDLMALYDAANTRWEPDEIDRLRALFHADQTPQPERRRTR